MLRKLYRVIITRLFGIGFSLLVMPALAALPVVEDVLAVLGMNQSQIDDLVPGQPVTYALSESSDDEIAAGIVQYFPIPVARVARHLRQDNPTTMDVGVTAYGLLTRHSGPSSFAPAHLSREEVEALFDVEPGDEFNLSASEIQSFNTLKQKSPKFVADSVLQHYREILFRRFEAYRGGGLNAIEPYMRDENRYSRPSLELREAANASALLRRYFPDLYKVWQDYPKPLPAGAKEAFPWVEKNVEGRPGIILRHRISHDWDDGVLVLTREFYAPHAYNSSQWITGCLPYRDGTVVFQQVHSYTDQVAGMASDVKHLIGRKLLKDKMLGSFERLCGVLGECR